MADNLAHPRQVVTINDLPEEVLLTIFDFYVVRNQDLDFIEQLFGDKDTIRKIESWKSLVHVCRRWRCLVFESRRRLNLHLCYTTGTPARETLDIWPVLPIVILGYVSEMSVDNVLAVLEHSDRICKINLDCYSTWEIEKLWTAMQVPFPELAILNLQFGGLSHVPVLPDSFLGGSAPRLRSVRFGAIPFPGLPKLLQSATHLVYLFLYDIPHSGYISPEAMATCLSMLTSLELLQLDFKSPQSCPDHENRLLPPPTRSILPSLTQFIFKGVNEYLEDLVSRIDSPPLDLLSTTFFNDIDFNTPELNQFISRTPTLRVGAYDEAHLIFHSLEALVKLCQSQSERSRQGIAQVTILSQVSNWQLSSLAQICTLSLHPFLSMENLYIYENPNSPPNWKDNVENTEWLDLLLPFAAVKNLYLSKQFSPYIAPALQELTGGRTREVLPTLQNVFLEGFQPSEAVQEGIAQFISTRQLTNHPVAISVWDRDIKKYF